MKASTWWVLFIALMFPALSPLKGQEARGTILGRLSDATGAVIVGATVEATDVGTGVSATSTTTGTGDYIFPYLVPGSYTLKVQSAGFRNFVRAGITVRAGDRIAIDATMEVGPATESVEVTSQSPILDTSTASTGQVLESRAALELPEKDGTPSMLAILVPGVLFQPGSGSPGYVRPFDTGGPSGLSIDGTRTQSNQFTVDGSPNMSGSTIAYSPPPSVVDEVKVATASFDAGSGYMAGAVVNVILKSGTNGVHGQTYYFMQNPFLNANRFFSNRVGWARLGLRIHRWGAALSGPVYLPKLYDGRNKTFFMFGYEGIWSFDPTPYITGAVPTTPQRQGDFSGLLALGSKYQIYDPYSITPAAGGLTSRQPLPNNVIPPSRISPIAAKMVNFWELPNQPGTIDGTNNWQRAKNAQDNYWNYLFRIDHNVSEKQRFFVRGDATSMWRPENLRDNGAYGDISWRYNRGLALDYVYVPSPTMFVNFKYSLTRFMTGAIPIRTSTQGMDWDLSALGFSSQFIQQINAAEAPLGATTQEYMQRITKANANGLALPVINVTNYLASDGTAVDYSSLSRSNTDIHDFQLNVTQIKASHTLRYGIGYRVLRYTADSFGNLSGSMTFDSTYTCGPSSSSAAAPLGQQMAAFLYGIPSSGSFPINTSSAEQSSVWAPFVQDDWKVSKKLTVSWGLRYERESPMTERYNRGVSGFNAAAASPIQAQVLANYANAPISDIPVGQFKVLGGLTFLGVGGLPRTAWNSRNHDFMPRIGLAYSLTPKTVFRAGYGIFFEPLTVTYLHSIQTGFNQSTTLVASNDNGQHFVGTLANPFPNGFLYPAGSAAGLSTALGQSISFWDPNMVNPYMQRWQSSVQRQLPGNNLIEVAYVGNRGTHQRVSPAVNPIPRQYLSTLPVRDQTTINYLTAQVTNPFYPLLPLTGLASPTVARSQLLLPYPQFTGASTTESQGYSWYHALQLHYEKRFSASLSASVSYTWSKLMEAMSFKNQSDPRPEEVISSYDRTYNLAVSWIYELPFGRGKRFANSVNRGLSGAISRWQVQGIYTKVSGPPLGFGNAIFNGNLHDIPLPRGQKTVDEWFDVNAGFQRNSSQALANNIQALSSLFGGIRGDGVNNWDLSVLKNANIREKIRLQFRVEGINALGHPQFNPPNTTPTSTAFGTVTTEYSWPRVIQLGLKILF